MVDAHQDFYMRIAMRIAAYADHPHEPHGSATAWPTLVQPPPAKDVLTKMNFMNDHFIHIVIVESMSQLDCIFASKYRIICSNKLRRR